MLDVGKIRFTAGETEIDLVGSHKVQHSARNGVFQNEGDAGMLVPELSDRIWQCSGCERGQGGDPDDATLSILRILRMGKNRIEILKYTLERGQQLDADACQNYGSRTSVE